MNQTDNLISDVKQALGSSSNVTEENPQKTLTGKVQWWLKEMPGVLKELHALQAQLEKAQLTLKALHRDVGAVEAKNRTPAWNKAEQQATIASYDMSTAMAWVQGSIKAFTEAEALIKQALKSQA